jgi:bifunctional non-homologous end joining protein LigD
MGKVWTGWSRTVSSRIRKKLETVASPKSELTRPIKKLALVMAVLFMK